MILKCSICGAECERVREYPRTACFDCKRKRKNAYKKTKTKESFGDIQFDRVDQFKYAHDTYIENVND